MSKIVFIFNPHCTKCNISKKILEDHKADVKVIDYLNGGLTKELLEEVVKALGARPKDILRTKEETFLSLNLDTENDSEVMSAILKHPIILERPIVLKDGKGVIGRPPEKILALFS